MPMDLHQRNIPPQDQSQSPSSIIMSPDNSNQPDHVTITIGKDESCCDSCLDRGTETLKLLSAIALGAGIPWFCKKLYEKFENFEHRSDEL